MRQIQNMNATTIKTNCQSLWEYIRNEYAEKFFFVLI